MCFLTEILVPLMVLVAASTQRNAPAPPKAKVGLDLETSLLAPTTRARRGGTAKTAATGRSGGVQLQ